MYLCCGAHDVGQPVLLRSPGCRKGPHMDKHEHLYWRMAQKKQEAEKRMQQHELAQLNTQRNVCPIPLQLSGIGTWATMVAPSLYRTTARRTRSRACTRAAFRAHCTGWASCLPGVVTLAAAAAHGAPFRSLGFASRLVHADAAESQPKLPDGMHATESRVSARSSRA